MEPEWLLAVCIAVGLVLYAVLGGADFGAGIWELNLALYAPPKERDLIYRAMGPVWEANHVWLIFVLVVLHTAFPPAFAAACRALWLPLLLALIGIVFRGSAFALRYYSTGGQGQKKLWSAVFAVSSAMTPFFLGTAVGAIASGTLPVNPEGHYDGDYLTDWISPFSLYVGLFTVGLCAYLAGVFLTRDAARERNATLAASWRGRALGTGVWTGALAIIGLIMVAFDVPHLWRGFVERSWVLVAASMAFGLGSLWSLRARRFTLAAFCAAAAVATVVAGWAVAQYPALIPPHITVEAARAPRRVLDVAVWGIALGGVILVPSLAWLLYLFKGRRPAS